MPDTLKKTAWGVRGSSTRGASHLRTGLPNQDSLGTWCDEPRNRAVVVVSDGHGSARHFRSDTGSRLAVAASMSILREVSLPISETDARALSRPIVETWRNSVQAHLAEHPFETADWKHVPDAEREQVQVAVAENPVVAYGATLLAVLAAGDDLLFLQLGDGDILCVSEDGTATRPMNEDSRLIANQTTSLCQNEAPENFRYAQIHADGDTLPPLILLSSDGYSNSFSTDADFLQVGSDYLNLLRQFGAEKVEAQLEHILSEASRKGSGDDITLGMLERLGGDVVTGTPPGAKSQSKSQPPSQAKSQTDPQPQSQAKSQARSQIKSQSPVAVDAEVGRAVDGPVKSHQAAPVAVSVGRAVSGPVKSQPAAPVDGSVPRLQRAIHGYQLALVAALLLAVAGIALAFWRPPAIEALFHMGGHGGPALRLPGGEHLALKAGTVLSAAQLRLKPPFEGPVLEVAASREGLVLRNRSGMEWSASGPGGVEPHRVGVRDSVPARDGERMFFGAVQVLVVSD